MELMWISMIGYMVVISVNVIIVGLWLIWLEIVGIVKF